MRGPEDKQRITPPRTVRAGKAAGELEVASGDGLGTVLGAGRLSPPHPNPDSFP